MVIGNQDAYTHRSLPPHATARRCTLAVLVGIVSQRRGHGGHRRYPASLFLASHHHLSCTLHITIAKCQGIERGKYDRFRPSESRWVVQTGGWVRGSSLASRDCETPGMLRGVRNGRREFPLPNRGVLAPSRLTPRGASANKVVPRRSHVCVAFRPCRGEGHFCCPSPFRLRLLRSLGSSYDLERRIV